MRSKVLLLLGLLIGLAEAGPTGHRERQQCSLKCNDSERKYLFEIGNAYKYVYKAITKVNMVEAGENSVDSEISAAVSIQPITSCDYILSLSHVDIHDTSRKEYFATEVSKNDLQFSIRDGRIEHLCHLSTEPSWVMNFKRGILSQFQNSMKNLRENQVISETDISGTCETTYSSTESGQGLTIKKTKLPSSCSGKPNAHNYLSAFGYSADALIQNLPLLKSSQECNQLIINGLIQKVDCTESHLFQPFDSTQSAAQTIVKSVINLVAVEAASSYDTEYDKRTSLIFSIENLNNKNENIIEEIKHNLQELKLAATNIFLKETPTVFSHLVNLLQELSFEEMQSLYETGDNIEKEYIIDALPLVKTETSVKFFAKLITENVIAQTKAQVWLTSLVFIKKPTVGMLEALDPLVEMSGNEVLLPVSSIVHNFCLLDRNCESRMEIQNILRYIESHLGKDCKASTKEQKESILRTLKALGNSGRFLNAESTLKRCYSEGSDVEIKIAAMNAWRRVPCSHDRKHFLNIFIDKSLDNEIRISSYLALMQCPNKDLIDMIKNSLSFEDVDHVTSFVWTHLSNLKETASIDKQWIRELMGEENLQKKFTADSLRLSKNYESSFYLPEQKIGATVDSNLILSDASFIPRSSMLNFTINLFGETVNLFEIGTRIEGFEYYLEKFFGPNGFYPEETVEAIIKNLREQKNPKYNNMQEEMPEGSFYLRMLGNELLFKHFNKIEDLMPTFNKPSIQELVMKFIRKDEVDIVKNHNLIDSEYIFPTIVGLPLKLKINGTASVGVKTDGNFDIKTPGSININGKLHPSMSVRVDSQMFIDGFVTKSGMKMVSTLHSSTAVEGRLILKNGKLLDLEVKIPQEKVELFEMSNEYLKIDNTEIKNASPKTVKKCKPLFCHAMGIDICTETMAEDSHYPSIYAPYRTKIYLSKTDPISSYVLRFVNENERKEIFFNMLGSKSDKRWSISYTKDESKYNFDIYTPHGRGTAKVFYDINPNKIDTKAKLNFNEHAYEARFFIEKNFDSPTKKLNYEILLDSSHHEEEIFFVTTNAEYDTNSKSFRFIKKSRHIAFQDLASKYNGRTVKAETEVNFVYGSKLSARCDIQLGSVPIFFYNLEIAKNSRGSYRISCSNDLVGIKTKLEGKLDYNISNQGISAEAHGLLKSSFESTEISHDLSWTLKANENELTSEANANCDGKPWFFNILIKKYAIKMESNIWKSVELHIDFSEFKSEGSAVISVTFDHISMGLKWRVKPDLIEANFNYDDREYNFFAKIGTQQVEALIEYSPTDKFSFNSSYFTNEGIFRGNLEIETPFEGWKKQAAEVSLSSDKNISGKITAKWGNEDHASLIFTFENKSEKSNKIYSSHLRFASSMVEIMAINLSVDHYSRGTTIQTDLIGKWNSQNINGHLKSQPNNNGYELNFSLQTPVTDVIRGSFSYNNIREEISIVSDFLFRSQLSKIVFRGSMKDSNQMSGTFKCSGPNLPDILTEFKLALSSEIKTIEFKGKWNENAASFITSCNLSNNENDNSCKLYSTISTSGLKVFAMSLSKSIDQSGHFKGRWEVSLPTVWEESIKGNYYGLINSVNSISISGNLDGPQVIGKFKFTHKYSQGSIKSDMSLQMNEFYLNGNVKGNVKLNEEFLSLNGKISSNLLPKNSIILDIIHKKINMDRETQIIIQSSEFAINILHNLSMKDSTNWVSNLKVNDYSLTNELSNIDFFSFKIEASCPTKYAAFSFQRAVKEKLEIEAAFNSSWTSDMKLTLNYDDKIKRRANATLYLDNKVVVGMKCAYEFSGNHSYSLEFSTEMIGSSPLFLNLIAITSPENSQTSFEVTVNGNNFISTIKVHKNWDSYNVKLKLHQNSKEIDLELNLRNSYVKLNGLIDGKKLWSEVSLKEKTDKLVLIFSMKSEFPNWESIDFDASIKKQNFPYILLANINKNGKIENYSIAFDLSPNTFSIKINSPVRFYEKIEISGLYKTSTDKIEAWSGIICNDDAYRIYTSINFKSAIPQITLSLESPFQQHDLKLSFNSELVKQKFIAVETEYGGKNYSIKLKADINKNRGDLQAIFDIPYVNIPTLKLSYDIENEVKFIKFLLEENADSFYLEGRLAKNVFSIELKTPIHNYEEISINGRYESDFNFSALHGKLLYNHQIYKFEGISLKTPDGQQIKISIPFGFLEPVDAIILLKKSQIRFKYNYNYKEYEITLNYLLHSNLVHIKLETPFESLSFFESEIRFEIDGEKASGNINVQKNSDRYKISGNAIASPLISKFELSFTVPMDNEIYKLQFSHDLLSVNKYVDFTYEENKSVKKFRIEVMIEEKQHAKLRLIDSFYAKGNYGLEYSFKFINSQEMEAYLVLYENLNMYKLGFVSKFNENKAEMVIYTPFTNYESFGIEGEYSPSLGKIKFQVLAGSKILNIAFNLNKNELTAMIETPFSFLQIMKLSLKYEWKMSKKHISFEYVYNSIAYEGSLFYNIANSLPNITLKLKSPFKQLRTLEIVATLDMNSPESVLTGSLNINSQVYMFTFGYEFGEWRGSVNLSLSSSNSYNYEFKCKLDLFRENKFLEIYLSKNGIKRMINISGKLYAQELDFEIVSPFEYYGNFKTHGSINRSKRSLNFQVMNDHHHGGIITSFNSFKFTAKTPYAKAKNIYLEVSKNANGWVIDYKRNNDKVFFNLNAETQKKVMAIKINSEIPGWELLALAGRIDLDEALLYIKGEKNSENIVITGTGSLGGKAGTLEINSKSNLANYKEVTTKIDYKAARNMFIIDSKSSSSDFKILLEIKRGLTIDVFVPNSEKNTIIKGNLTPFKGNVVASSRFPFMKDMKLNYETKLGPIIKSNLLFEINGLKMIEFEFERNSDTNIAHLMFHGRRKNSHSMLHFHREGWNKVQLVFERNGKEFKVDVTGTGDLPRKGEYKYEIKNSFREVTRIVTGSITVDRTVSPKEITAIYNANNGKYLKANIKYNAELDNKRKGDFVFKLMRKTKDRRPYDNISGKWNIENMNDVQISIKMASKEHKATGKLGLYETNLVITSDSFKGKEFFVQWKFSKVGYERDHYLKIGREDRYIMMKLQGTIKDIFNGDINGALRISRFMKNDLEFTSKWSRTEKGLTGSGKFSYGEYSGTHTLLNLKRNAVDRAAKIHWEATSNIEKFNNIKLIGEYSLKKKMIDMKLSWDTDEFYVKGALDNFSYLESKNTLKFHLPKIGDGEITLSHNFNDPLAKSITAIGKIGAKKFEYVINWTRNKEFTVLNLNANIKSGIFGDATIKADYNIENINDAKANLEYKRNNDKFINIRWTRIKTEKNLKAEWNIESHFTSLPSARIYLDASWEDGFILNGGCEYNNKKIELKINVGKNKTTASFTTPYEKISDMNLDITYDLKNENAQKFSLNYKRGDRVVKANMDLKRETPEKGSLVFTLETPFEVIKNVNFDANWNDGNFDAVYKRNDIEVKATGTAKVKTGNSSFNVAFNLPSGKKIQLELAYDLMNFIKGSSSTTKTIITNKIQIEDQSLEYTVKGHRTSEKIFLEINGSKSFGKIKTFYIKLDSELNLSKRVGRLEIKADEFHFDMKNTFEKGPNRYYAKSQMKSTLTDLPGITIGFGRDGDSFILISGWGDAREITITFKGKDHFKKGFYGTIDLPYRNILGMEYNVDYNFPSEDELQVNIKIQVKEGKFIEANIDYNSTGVKGRLNSPWTGLHSGRFRRSVKVDYYLTDIAVDNYNLMYENDGSSHRYKKNFRIEGEIFGERLLIEGFVNAKDITDLEAEIAVNSSLNMLRNSKGHLKVQSSNGLLQGEISLKAIHSASVKMNIDLREQVRGNIDVTLDEKKYKCIFDVRRANSKLQGTIVVNTSNPLYDYLKIEYDISKLSLEMIQGKAIISTSKSIYSLDVSSQMSKKSCLMNISVNFPENVIYDIKIDYHINRSSGEISSDMQLSRNKKLYFKYELKLNIKDSTGEFKIVSSQHSLSFNSYSPFTLKNHNLRLIYEGKMAETFEIRALRDKVRKSINLNINISHDFKVVLDYESEYNSKSFSVESILYNNILEYKLDKTTSYAQQKLEKIVKSIFRISLPTQGKKYGTNYERNELRVANNITNHCSLSLIVNKMEINFSNEYEMSDFRNANSFNKYKLIYIYDEEIKEKYVLKRLGKYENGVKYALSIDTHLIENGLVSFESIIEMNFENKYGISLNLRAPITRYELINLEVGYSSLDLNTIIMRASPIGLKAKAQFGLMKDVYIAQLQAETELEQLKLLNSSMEVPLRRFSPIFSNNINGNEYNLKASTENEGKSRKINVTSKIIDHDYELNLWYKEVAPYELGVNLAKNDEIKKFAVIFDSSFLVLKDTVAALF